MDFDNILAAFKSQFDTLREERRVYELLQAAAVLHAQGSLNINDTVDTARALLAVIEDREARWRAGYPLG